MLSVGAPDGIGVVAAGFGNGCGRTSEHVIYIYGSVGAERILLAGFLAAAICNVPAVRRPVQLLGSAERFSGKFVEVVVPENVYRILCSNLVAVQRGDIASGNLRYPMIPVAVHEILCGIGLCLVKHGIGVGWLHKSRILYGGSVDDLRFIGRYLEFADSRRDIAQEDLFSEFVTLERRFPQLSALYEIDAPAVFAPAGVAHAFCIARELYLAGAVPVTKPEVAVGCVLFY